MNAKTYYQDIGARSSAWNARAAEPCFAPLGVVIEMIRSRLATGGRVLDIGCQGGHQVALLASEFDELFGIDICEYQAMWQLFPQVRFSVFDVDSGPLPFPDSHFRSVLCTNLLEHVFDVFGTVREIERVLVPGGTAFISVPNVASWRHVRNLMRGRVPRTGASEYPFNEVQGWDGQHLHYFTHSEMEWLLRHAGLMPIWTATYGRLPHLKRAAPRFLSGSVDIVARKVPTSG